MVRNTIWLHLWWMGVVASKKGARHVSSRTCRKFCLRFNDSISNRARAFDLPPFYHAHACSHFSFITSSLNQNLRLNEKFFLYKFLAIDINYLCGSNLWNWMLFINLCYSYCYKLLLRFEFEVMGSYLIDKQCYPSTVNVSFIFRILNLFDTKYFLF